MENLSGRKRAADGSVGEDELAAAAVGAVLHDEYLFPVLATMLPPGADLTHLCHAIGPERAARLRNGYLLGNEQYVPFFLRRVQRLAREWSLDLRTLMNSNVKDTASAAVLHAAALQRRDARDITLSPRDLRGLEVLRHCRDRIRAWMAVNDWRSRITKTQIRKYRILRVETDAVFNNPLIAFELGLAETYHHLVSTYSLNPNDRLGFASLWDPYVTCERMLEVAMICGGDDEFLVTCVLSADFFTLNGSRMTLSMESALASPCVSPGCLNAFLGHPKTRAHCSVRDFDNFRNIAIEHLERAIVRGVEKETAVRQRLAKVRCLLEVGAAPISLRNHETFGTACAHCPIWRELVKEMEALLLEHTQKVDKECMHFGEACQRDRVTDT